MANLTKEQLQAAYENGVEEAHGYLEYDNLAAIGYSGTREEALTKLRSETQERLEGAINRKDGYHIQVFQGMLDTLNGKM